MCPWKLAESIDRGWDTFWTRFWNDSASEQRHNNVCYTNQTRRRDSNRTFTSVRRDWTTDVRRSGRRGADAANGRRGTVRTWLVNGNWLCRPGRPTRRSAAAAAFATAYRAIVFFHPVVPDETATVGFLHFLFLWNITPGFLRGKVLQR